MIFPRELKQGDRILLVSLSSPLTADQPVEEIARRVEALGFRPVIGESCRSTTPCGYAAAPAEIRVADLHRGFSDSTVDAIWCTRGGSTAWQLLPLLDAELIRANPKPLIGFSDVTTLHMYLQQRCNMVSFHGPTANRVFTWAEDTFSWPNLQRALTWEGELSVENPPGEGIITLRPGIAEGEMVGGNLTLIADSLGTPWQIQAKGRVLFLEEVGEGVYRLDRMLSRLRYAGVLDDASAVVLGAFTNCRNAYRADYGPDALVRDFFANDPKPVLYGVRSAHCSPMVTLPLGCMCRVDGDRGALTFFK